MDGPSHYSAAESLLADLRAARCSVVKTITPQETALLLAELQVHAAQARSLISELAELGVTATAGNHWHPENLVISLDNVAALLARIPGAAATPAERGEGRG